MKRLVIAALVVAALGAVASSATASSSNGVGLTSSSPIYDSTPAPLPGNIPSVGGEAYAFNSLGNKIQFVSGSRKLMNVVVTLSSFACSQGHWDNGSCYTPAGATFQQPVTLKIWDGAHTNVLASSTRSFNVPYRPSASRLCAADPDHPGGWYQPATTKCFNGLATQVSFDFGGNVTLPDTVVYEISYNTTHYGPSPIGEQAACFRAGNCPYDSLNIGLSNKVNIGSDPDQTTVWANGAASSLYDSTYKTPAVQFIAARLWKV